MDSETRGKGDCVTLRRMEFNEQEVLQGLNPGQKQAVLHETGPMLVLAGAGSGKTRVLTHRIAYLLGKGVDARAILAVTFTNKAAGEMRERLAALTRMPESSLPLVSTFHSFCVKFLRSEIEVAGYDRSFTIYDDADQKALIKQVMKDRNLPAEQIKPRTIRTIISKWKNDLRKPAEAESMAQSYIEEIAAEVYEAYQGDLRKANALDFDDLLLLSVEILESHPEVLARYQERFEQILVDEYQDTNAVQYRLVTLLAQKHQNLFVVGDDWQSIYGWRGANIKNILDFERDYPDATVVKLEQNYRSTQHILDAADYIIKQNKSQKEKTLYTEAGDGERVQVVEARDAFDEARVIARDLQMQSSKGESLDQAAVLYRTNAQSRVLERILLERNVPYRIVGGVRFYDRKEVKDILGYLRLLHNPNDLASLDRVINEPKRGIGEKTKAALVEFARVKGVSLIDAAVQAQATNELTQGTRAKLGMFGAMMAGLQEKTATLPVSGLIQKVAQETGTRDALKDGTDEGEARWENVLELAGASKKYDNDHTQGLALFLEEVALISDLDKTTEVAEEAVTLMTMHNAKGLEFHTVYVVGCEEGIFPHSRTLESQIELEEENRLCYVAMTRAKRRLFLLHAIERDLYGTTSMNERSRYLELPPGVHETKSSSEFARSFGTSEGRFARFRRPERLAQARSAALDDAFQQSYEEPSIQVDEDQLQEQGDVYASTQEVSVQGTGQIQSAQDSVAAGAEWKSGQSVQHPVFGKGVVVVANGNDLTIAFAKFGLKKLDAEVSGVQAISSL